VIKREGAAMRDPFLMEKSEKSFLRKEDFLLSTE